MRSPRISDQYLSTLQARGFTWSENIPRLVPCPDRALVISDQHLILPKKRYGSGKRADLGGLYQRCTAEANYSRYLNWCKDRKEIQAWTYEPREFEFPVKRGSAKFYKPDWEVILPDGRIQYRELKGELKPEGATKLKRMQKYYPQHELLVIWWKDYLAIEKMLGENYSWLGVLRMNDLMALHNFLICRRCMTPIAHPFLVPIADQDSVILVLACHGEREDILLTGSEMVTAGGLEGKLNLIYLKSRLLGGESALPEES